MVDSLLAFKGMLDKVAAGPFRDHQELSQAVRAGFEVFINKRQNKPAEMLGAFSWLAGELLSAGRSQVH
jgi:cullin-4